MSNKNIAESFYGISMKTYLLASFVFLTNFASAAEQIDFWNSANDSELGLGLQNFEDNNENRFVWFAEQDSSSLKTLSDLQAGLRASEAEQKCSIVDGLESKANKEESMTLADFFSRRKGRVGFLRTDMEGVISVLLNIIDSFEERQVCISCQEEIDKTNVAGIGVTTCCNQYICTGCKQVLVIQERCPHCRACGEKYGIFRYDGDNLFLTTTYDAVVPEDQDTSTRCCIVQ